MQKIKLKSRESVSRDFFFCFICLWHFFDKNILFGKVNIGDNLKLILKFFVLLAIGLSIAVIIYPFLHEVGHSLSAIMLGAEIKSFQILPVSSVLVKMNSGTSEFSFLIIGFSGMLFPFIMSFFLSAKNFWKWYARITLRLICILSFLLGIVAMLMYQQGNPIQNDDATIILKNSPQYMPFCFVILILLTVTSITFFVKDFVIFNKKKLYNTF